MEETIHFTLDRWKTVKENYRKWWGGELGRPLMNVTVYEPPGESQNSQAHPFQHFTTNYPPSITAEEIVVSWEAYLSRQTYLADGFPHIWPNFGPGVVAAFLGAEVGIADNTVWFHPAARKELAEWSFVADLENNPWFERIDSIMKAAIDRWQGLVQVGMTDLGGNLDILSSFRPGEDLLFDLYDHPEAVKNRTWQAHEAWWRAYGSLNERLQPANPGYTAWTPIFSETPYYILQCDFCYMIGPEMFDEFVKPELTESCRKLDHAFYHLDGPGQLKHLDSLLEIDELDGVQWVPGAGAPPITEWPEVHRKISEAGKKIQISGGVDTLETIAEQIGRADNIVCFSYCSTDHADDLVKRLARFGIEPELQLPGSKSKPL